MEADRAKDSSSGQAMQDVEALIAEQEEVDVVWSGLFRGKTVQ